MTIPSTRLAQISARFAELEARLASGTLEGADFVAASRDYAELEPVARAAEEVTSMRGELESLAALNDPDMRELAEEEMARIREALPQAERALSIAMLPRDNADSRPAMLEIRAGTGGDEAALFAADLFRMYERFAAQQGWRVEMVSANASEIGGFKEVVAHVSGQGVFAKLKFESGVHRVQRVPVTEAGGRIHTSAATVAILPEPDEVDVQIEDKDLKIDIYRASGAGGQHVNTTDSAVILKFDVAASPSLPDAVKYRLARIAGTRMTAEGVIVLRSEGSRSQMVNRQDVRARLIAMIVEATFVPKARKATKPTKASQTRRMDGKSRRSSVKAGRGKWKE